MRTKGKTELEVMHAEIATETHIMPSHVAIRRYNHPAITGQELRRIRAILFRFLEGNA